MTKERLISLMLAIAAAIGCDSADERLARMAQESVDQQQKQNEEMARVNREVAEGVKHLVKGDGETRKELVALQRDLQEQQAQISYHYDGLEAERKQLAEARLRESLMVPVLSNIGLFVVCSLPLVLCWYLLHGWQRESAVDDTLGELLIEELAAEHPKLLPSVDTGLIDRRLPPGLPESASGLSGTDSEEPS